MVSIHTLSGVAGAIAGILFTPSNPCREEAVGSGLLNGPDSPENLAGRIRGLARGKRTLRWSPLSSVFGHSERPPAPPSARIVSKSILAVTSDLPWLCS